MFGKWRDSPRVQGWKVAGPCWDAKAPHRAPQGRYDKEGQRVIGTRGFQEMIASLSESIESRWACSHPVLTYTAPAVGVELCLVEVTCPSRTAWRPDTGLVTPSPGVTGRSDAGTNSGVTSARLPAGLTPYSRDETDVHTTRLAHLPGNSSCSCLILKQPRHSLHLFPIDLK